VVVEAYTYAIGSLLLFNRPRYAGPERLTVLCEMGLFRSHIRDGLYQELRDDITVTRNTAVTSKSQGFDNCPLLTTFSPYEDRDKNK